MTQASGKVKLACVGIATVELVRSLFGHRSPGEAESAPSAWGPDQEEIFS